jgi:phosphoserine aminotransferase
LRSLCPVCSYANAPVGRSHRSKVGKAKLSQAINETRELLGIPDDYKVRPLRYPCAPFANICAPPCCTPASQIGIMPASDTGAIEAAMWSMLGKKPVDCFYWEAFGADWMGDCMKELKIEPTGHQAEFGDLPDFTKYNPDNDTIFTFNGTTAGVRLPNLDWITNERTGLTFNDATSAVFAMDFDWTKADVTTYSWQKVLGGEGAHGMLILSPRAVERLETYKPDRPLPKIFRMAGAKGLSEGIFKGETINTPSMICVEDYLDALQWTKDEGGLAGLIRRSEANLAVMKGMVAQNDWIDFLCNDEKNLSNTSVCFTLDMEKAQIKEMEAYLAAEGVAYDINSYKSAPPGLRIWCGATVETSDLEALVPWIEHAYAKFKK